jgi:hypothetical protein
VEEPQDVDGGDDVPPVPSDDGEDNPDQEQAQEVVDVVEEPNAVDRVDPVDIEEPQPMPNMIDILNNRRDAIAGNDDADAESWSEPEDEGVADAGQ